MKIFSFLRPVLTQEMEVVLPFRLRAAEKTITPVVVSPDGSTAILEAVLQADVDPTGGVTNVSVFDCVFTPTLSVDGKLNLQIDVRSLLGDGSNGQLQTKSVQHEQVMDTFLSMAGIPRTDPAGGGETVTEVVKTSDYSVLITDLGVIFSNAGAGGMVTITLPVAAALPVSGIPFRIRGRVSANQIFRFQTQGSDVIYQGAGVGTPGGYLQSNSPGAQVEFLNDEAGKWVAAPLGPTNWSLS
jgi:hypothetical protein